MITFLQKTFGDTNEKRLKKYYNLVEKINEIEPKFERLSDQELREQTQHFKNELQNGATIDDIKVEAFAVVREASKRVLGMRHFDVQLIGGLVLTEGNIAEMATGEGKTLVASLPSYLRALEGNGVHVITVNDYLANRDRNLIGKIHEFLGLTVGLNLPMMDQDEKKRSYQADITYGVGTEFGFDYLRDNMAQSSYDQVQRPFHFAIIDEVDSVLIDEAKTPLIIAGKMSSSKDLHYIAAKLAKRFIKDEDYSFDGETKATSLTEKGIEKVEKAFGVDNLYDLEHQTLYHYVLQAVRAHVMFEKDVDYIVQDGKIFLVDMFTGRVMEGRSLSDGLHQAIEAKEGIDVTDENKTQASITIQNYFRMYANLSGMTGTAKTEEKEFRQVYGMSVIQIPTNKPKIRVDLADRVYRTKHEKYQAVTKKVQELNSKDQPVLIGTTSILQSETIADYMNKAGLKYQLLNAKSVEQEVELISEAGQKGKITIATNMAGRGTDILLGDGVANLGGLYVIGTEKHESRRIDGQLKGRSGRQGDPGSSEFFISVEDDMFIRYANEEVEKIRKKINADENGLILNNNIHDFVDKVQRIVEGSNYGMREYNLKLDDVINEQRNIIYSLRNKILSPDRNLPLFIEMIDSIIKLEVDSICSDEVIPEDWKINELDSIIHALLPGTEISLTMQDDLDKRDIERTVQEAFKAFCEKLKNTENDIVEYLKPIMSSTIDQQWIQHLENMNHLKEGIGLRQYQQEDPMRLYQKEGLELFTETYHRIEKQVSLKFASVYKQIELPKEEV